MAKKPTQPQFDDNDEVQVTAAAMDHSNGTSDEYNDSESTGLSIDELNAKGFDNEERDAENYKRMNPPAGDWVKKSHWTYEKFVISDDRQPGDVDPAGRTILSFTGKPETRIVDGIDYEPMIRLRISPDLRTKENERTGEVENTLDHKLYLFVKFELYVAMKGEKPRSIGDIARFLEYDEFGFRTMKGTDSPVILELFNPATRKARRPARR